MATSAREPPTVIVSEAVEPPHEFGQDGGKFYRCYDVFAEEIDEDMSQGLKEQLDGLLVFVSPRALSPPPISALLTNLRNLRLVFSPALTPHF